MKKQTAVELLINTLLPTISIRLSETYIKELTEKAKAIEKQQIIDAFDGHPLIARNSQNGEEYYELTFNQK